MRPALALILLAIALLDLAVGSAPELVAIARERAALGEARSLRAVLEAAQQLRAGTDPRARERMDAALAGASGAASRLRGELAAGNYDVAIAGLLAASAALDTSMASEPALARAALRQIPPLAEFAARIAAAGSGDVSDLQRAFEPLGQLGLGGDLAPDRLRRAVADLAQLPTTPAAARQIENAAWAVVGESYLLQDKLIGALRDRLDERRRWGLLRLGIDAALALAVSLLLLARWRRAWRAARARPAP